MTTETATGSETPETPLVVSEVAPQTEADIAREAEAKAEKPTETKEADQLKPDDAKVSEAAKTLSEAKQRKAEESRTRWNDMQRQRFDAIERADKAERELADLKTKLKPPVVGEYDDNAKYTADMVQHTLDKNEVQRRADEIVQRRQQADEIKVRQWAEKREAVLEKYPDFDTKVGRRDLPITPAMTDAIVASPVGAEIAYELASNIPEAARIARMSPVEQAMEIGAIASRLNAPPPKKITQAPAPVNAVKGSGGSAGAFDYVNASMDDYAKQRRKDAKDA